MSTSPAPAAPPEASADASAPSSSPATSTDVVDVESLKAKAAEYDALKAKLDDQKRAEREERKRLQAEAEKAGEVSKAYEAAKARLAELEGLEPLAQKWRAYEAEEAKRLDTEAAAMPDAVRDLYATAGDIDAKRKVLAAFRAAAPGAPSKGTAPSMGAPPAVSGADFEAALADHGCLFVHDRCQLDPHRGHVSGSPRASPWQDRRPLAVFELRRHLGPLVQGAQDPEEDRDRRRRR
jgi:hypothetical protein